VHSLALMLRSAVRNPHTPPFSFPRSYVSSHACARLKIGPGGQFPSFVVCRQARAVPGTVSVSLRSPDAYGLLFLPGVLGEGLFVQRGRLFDFRHAFLELGILRQGSRLAMRANTDKPANSEEFARNNSGGVNRMLIWVLPQKEEILSS